MAEVLPPRSDNQDFYSPPSHSFFLHHPDLDTSTSMLNLGASAESDHNDATSFSRSHSRASTSDLSSMLSLVTPSHSTTSALEDKYRQKLDSEDDYPHFDSYVERFGERTDEPQPVEIEDISDDGYARHDGRPEEQREPEGVANDDETVTTASDISLPTPTVVDDTAMRQEPSQHVDYLSHDWKEEDVWSSWRHIVSQRKVYGQQSRLENAAWRTWIKNKYHLRTVSPETLNWLKESDVTWLYGPLKPAQSHPITQSDHTPENRIWKSSSFIMNKKPILKKRSMSEVMLQKSISTSSLVKQAAASIHAQGRGYQTRLGRVPSDYISSGVISEVPSREDQAASDYFGSSGTGTPSDGCGRSKKHIRFDDTVEQCIAVEAKPEEYEEDDEEDDLENDEAQFNALSSSSSDEGLVMLRKKPRRPGVSRSESSRGSRSSSQSRKTIETLPSTTLKYRTDSPEISEQQQQAAQARSWSARPRLSPSASQETLRPSRPSRNFLLGAEEEAEDEEVNEESSWSFGASNPRSSLGAAANTSSDALPDLAEHDTTNLPRSRSKEKIAQRNRVGTPRASLDEAARDGSSIPAGAARQLPALQTEPGAYGMEGMRRTESGMFMPEDDEDDIIATGLFGRLSDTVNTARDIAHVIWNVGWRK